MKNLNVLWAVAMSAIGGAIIYVTGREDGQKEGVAEGLAVGIDIGQNIANENIDKAEVTVEIK